MDIQAICTNVERGADGIWQARDTPPVSYPAAGHDICFQVEAGSFWFTHRNACIEALVRRLPPPGTLFDIGGGNGFVAAGLQASGLDVVLVEPGPAGAANGHRRGVREVICATARSAGILPGTVPGIGLFDVIEHVDDHLGFLQSMHALLVPGGRLYATVPAYDLLWSAEDVQAGHCRRYTRASICTVLRSAGFEIDYASHFFRPLPLPILLLRALPFRLGIGAKAPPAERARNAHAVGGGIGRKVLDRLLDGEVADIARGRAMPFGASIVLAASRSPAIGAPATHRWPAAPQPA